MKIISARQLALGSALALAAMVLISSGCDDSPTTARVANRYPPPIAGAASADTTTVFKAWWVTTLFPNPVPAGTSSEPERTIEGSDFAYALLAPGWSPDKGAPPTRLVAIKSVKKLTASAHDLLTIEVSDDQFAGNCAAGSTLTDDDARLIVERIFPGDFTDRNYDPSTCTSTPAPSDAAVVGDGGETSDAATD